MTTSNISLSDSQATFIAEQVTLGGFGNCSEFLGELISKEQDRQQLRRLLLQGAESPLTTPADGQYFERLRSRVQAHAKENA